MRCSASLGMLLLGCGARSGLEQGSLRIAEDGSAAEAGVAMGDAAPRDSGASSGGGDADAGPSTSQCTADGVRICGGTCEDGGCAICTPLIGANGPETYGVCWSDLEDFGDTACAFCDIGEGCVERTPNRFVCVPLSVCALMMGLGETDVCWYSDKTPYTGSATASVSTCPASSTYLCGIDCNTCVGLLNGGGGFQGCLGTGATSPLGFCVDFTSEHGVSNSTAAYPTCAMATSTSPAMLCPSGQGYDLQCATFTSPPADSHVAALNGICLEAGECASISAALNGRVVCN
jgi:hypothetical protein